MTIHTLEHELINEISKFDTKSIGFVPTMGALHQGHLSLIEKASTENTVVIVSIFINPIQFNNPNDLANYPSTLEADLELIQKTNSNCIVFHPNAVDLYKNRKTNKKYSFDGIEKQMEGKFRANHFNGVATVVELLFEITRASKAYFGEKDYQQLAIIKKLVSKKNIPTKVIGCPIVREENGLAMSSRNTKLSQNARNEASIIFKTLQKIKTQFKDSNFSELKKIVSDQFQNASNFTLEYFEICNETTLSSHQRKQKNIKYRAFIAVYIENVRLIDNISLN